MAFNWNNYWRQQGMAAAQSQQTPAPVHAGVPPTQFQPLHPALAQYAQHIAHAADVPQASSQTSPWNFTATPGPPELTHAPPPVVGSSVSTPGGPPPVQAAQAAPSAPLQQLAQNIAYNPTFGSSFPNAQPNPASTQTNPAMNGPGYAVTDPSYYQGFINAGLNPSASYSASNLSSTLNPQTMASLGYQVGTSNFNPSAGPQYFGPLIAANQYTK